MYNILHLLNGSMLCLVNVLSQSFTLYASLSIDSKSDFYKKRQHYLSKLTLYYKQAFLRYSVNSLRYLIRSLAQCYRYFTKKR